MVWYLDVDSSLPEASKRFQRLGCSPIKVVRELGLERCEAVWFLSFEKIYVKFFYFFTRGLNKANLWCINCLNYQIN